NFTLEITGFGGFRCAEMTLITEVIQFITGDAPLSGNFITGNALIDHIVFFHDVIGEGLSTADTAAHRHTGHMLDTPCNYNIGLTTGDHRGSKMYRLLTTATLKIDTGCGNFDWQPGF